MPDGDERLAIVDSQLVDVDDVSVLQESTHPGLVEELFLALRSAHPQELDRHGLAEAGRSVQHRPKDPCHAPLTEYGLQCIATKRARQIAGGEHLGLHELGHYSPSVLVGWIACTVCPDCGGWIALSTAQTQGPFGIERRSRRPAPVYRFSGSRCSRAASRCSRAAILSACTLMVAIAIVV